MIAFSCALYNIITGRHFVKYWVPGGGGGGVPYFVYSVRRQSMQGLPVRRS